MPKSSHELFYSSFMLNNFVSRCSSYATFKSNMQVILNVFWLNWQEYCKTCILGLDNLNYKILLMNEYNQKSKEARIHF